MTKSKSKLNILFVDDDKVALKMVKGILESAGYGVTVTMDPREALEKLTHYHFDLLISDANMPGGISGFDLVRTIRSQPRFGDLTIALLTGRREKQDIRQGL